ncbi:MAG: Rne/Rng family ribonuclease [Chitinivibrionales bacterium]|nr:Rne/Rng family ribonuclease [Chitinivibrionales bacterium]MBD3356725.1 Rne/Rng family ribonuclease [Chitinivibrionales bacterium]
MEKEILLSSTSTEKRAVLLEDKKVVELAVERPQQYRLLGNIYRGKIVSILPGIQSAFVDIGQQKNVFLHAADVDPALLLDNKDEALIERYTDRGRSSRRKVARVPIEQVLEEGQEILVQVVKEPIGNKSAKVTTQISIAGRFLVLVPDTDFIGVSKKTSDLRKRRRLKELIAQIKPAGIGFIVRTIGLKVSETEFVNEIHSLIEAWRETQELALKGTGPCQVYREEAITTRVIRDMFSEDVKQLLVDLESDYNEVRDYLKAAAPNLLDRVKMYKAKVPLFDKYDIEKELERSVRRKVWLKSGGYLLIDHTEALLAIDVNTGRNVGKASLEETIYKTNLEAVPEICRQLRLRDLGGIIVVDFIDMRRTEHRRRIEEEVRRTVRRDPTATSCTGLSKFGLMEITRKRVRPELQELYTDVCHACNGLGRVFSPATVTTRIDRELKRTGASGSKNTVTLAIHPAVAAYLHENEDRMVHQLEREHDCRLEIMEDEELDQDEFEVRRNKTDSRRKGRTGKQALAK